MRSCPMAAPSRASSVESCSGAGCGRVNNVCCRTRPGVGSIVTVTRSIAIFSPGGGCDSRSSSASVRSERTSRSGEGNSSRRVWTSFVTSPSCTCSTATPRSRRSRRIDSGSSRRVSTNDSGSRPSIGHSRSSDASKRSSARSGTSGRMSSPRAMACHRRPCRPSRAERSAEGSAARSPSVLSPQRLNKRSLGARGSGLGARRDLCVDRRLCVLRSSTARRSRSARAPLLLRPARRRRRQAARSPAHAPSSACRRSRRARAGHDRPRRAAALRQSSACRRADGRDRARR